MDAANKLRDLLKCSFVPELKQDLDSVQIEEKHFSGYRLMLQTNLPILYDFVQQNEAWIFESNEADAQEIYGCLIVLLCEVTATDTVFKIKDVNLLANANRLLLQHLPIDNSVMNIILLHYQGKLKRDGWKRQLGSVHGFIRFLQLCYVENKKDSCKMATIWLTFSLSIGLIICDTHEILYKQISARIFQIMLDRGDRNDVLNLNIHSVIYDAVFKNSYIMDSAAATTDIWNCLCRCLDFFNNFDSYTWNYCDDMLETLLRNITLAPNNQISVCLLKYVTKLCCYFTMNRLEIETKYNADFNDPLALAECRQTCANNTSYTPYRWAKSILNLFIIESYKLKQNVTDAQQLLQEMHRCYMVSILPITLQVIEPHLVTFFEKYPLILMEVIRVHKSENHIVKLIYFLLATFHHHLRTSSYCDKSTKLKQYRDSFEQLLTHEIFVEYK